MAALLGSAWAAFLLPPQLTDWDGPRAPAWAQRLDGSAPYDLLRQAGSALGVVDDYVLFGVLVAPSFVLVGVPLLAASRGVGRAARATGWLTILGAAVTIASYGGYGLGEPWDVLWGIEGLLLIVVGVVALVAGLRALRTRRVPRWWAVMLAATVVVLVVSTLAFTYFPHGTLVAYGVEVAVLAGASGDRLLPARRGDRHELAVPGR